MPPMDIVLLLLTAYGLGSVPFAYLVARAYGVADIRTVGSGNVGATNVVRAVGKKAGAITFLLDAGKGAIVVLAVRHLGYSETMTCMAGVLAVLGHIFPIWLKFKGGKGVATTLAVITALCWSVGLATVAVWLVIFIITRVSSLSAILAMGSMPMWASLWADATTDATALCLAIVVIAKHHCNIRRLLNGEEKPFRRK